MKTQAVKARSVSENGFWRCGKLWPPSGAVYDLEPTEIAILRSEPRLVVLAVAAKAEDIDKAEAATKSTDEKLLAEMKARSNRRSKRLATTHSRVGTVKEALAEIEGDLDEDSVTRAEARELEKEYDKLSARLKELEVADGKEQSKSEQPKPDPKPKDQDKAPKTDK